MWTVLTWLTADCGVNQLRGPDPFSEFWHDWNGQMNLIRAGPKAWLLWAAIWCGRESPKVRAGLLLAAPAAG